MKRVVHAWAYDAANGHWVCRPAPGETRAWVTCRGCGRVVTEAAVMRAGIPPSGRVYHVLNALAEQQPDPMNPTDR